MRCQATQCRRIQVMETELRQWSRRRWCCRSRSCSRRGTLCCCGGRCSDGCCRDSICIIWYWWSRRYGNWAKGWWGVVFGLLGARKSYGNELKLVIVLEVYCWSYLLWLKEMVGKKFWVTIITIIEMNLKTGSKFWIAVVEAYPISFETV